MLFVCIIIFLTNKKNIMLFKHIFLQLNTNKNKNKNRNKIEIKNTFFY